MSSNGQINQQQQPQNAALPFSGPMDPAGLDGGMGMDGPVLVGVPVQQDPALSGHTAQMLSVNAENIAMRNDGLSLMQEPYGDGQGIPLTRPTSGSSLSPDMQGQGTASSLVPSLMLPTFGSATQAAGGTHIHGQPAQLAVIQPASTQPPSNALLLDGSRLPSSAEALAEQTNIPIEVAQQIMDDAMSRRRLLSENQQLMDALARVCPECSTAVIILLLEMLDRERCTVVEHEERQAMAKQIVELRTAFNELAAKLAEIRQDGRGDDSELSEDEM